MPDLIWYYVHQNQQVGPISGAELRRLLQSGGIAASDLVWREGMEQWQPAANVRGLLGEGNAPGPAVAETQTTDLLQSASDWVPTNGSPPSAAQRFRQLWVMLRVMQLVLWGLVVVVALVVMLLALLVPERGWGSSTYLIAMFILALTGEKISLLVLSLLDKRTR